MIVTIRKCAPALLRVQVALLVLTLSVLGLAVVRLEHQTLLPMLFLLLMGVLMGQLPVAPARRAVLEVAVAGLSVGVLGMWPALIVVGSSRAANAVLPSGHQYAEIPAPITAEQLAAATLATAAMGVVHSALAPGLAAALAAGAAYAAVRSGIHLSVEWVRFQYAPSAALSPTHVSMVAAHLVGASMGLLVARVYPQAGIPTQTVLVFSLFSLLVLYSSGLVTRRRVAYWDALGVLASAIEAKKGANTARESSAADLSAAIACKLGLSEEQVTAIYLGALLRDVGMVAVSESVLNRAGPLNDDETVMLRRHVDSGESIIANIPYLSRCVPIIRAHHERPDGTGYPLGLTGTEIPLEARIVGLVDAYCSLTSDRPYRLARSPEDALAELAASRAWERERGLLSSLAAAVREEMRWGKAVFQSHYSFSSHRGRTRG